MLIPERTRRVHKLVIPTFMLRIGGVFLSLASLLGVVLAVDYAHVLARLAENKRLKGENFKLRQEMQLIRNKIETMETTVERVRNYAKKLQILTGQDKRADTELPMGGPDSLEPRLDVERRPAGVPRGRRAPSGGDTTSLVEPEGLDGDGSQWAGAGGGVDDDAVVAAVPVAERIEQLQEASENAEKLLARLQSYLVAQSAIIEATPSLLPTVGFVSSSFGYRRNPYNGTFRLHAGIDIAAETGTPVRAPAKGTVVYSGYREGYGKCVVIHHGYGISTLFAHNSKLYVTVGAKVRRGEVIAEVGSTGHSTGPHLHFEIRKNGVPVNPVTFFRSRL
jgi:murein DD-endopeptidase MepM/ murein hydrolase activator NlpD